MEQRTSSDRALTLDEAVSVALALQQAAQWAAAEDIYRTILEAAPNHADALHFSGVLAQQRGRTDDAVALIERSLELEPERADGTQSRNCAAVSSDWTSVAAIGRLHRSRAMHSNLGVVLREKLNR